MKRILLVLSLALTLSSIARAGDVLKIDLGRFGELNCPLQQDAAVTLYDWRNGVGKVGLETTFYTYTVVNLNFGAVTSQIGIGEPFMSLNIKAGTLSPNIPIIGAIIDLPVGLFAGYDFQGNYLVYGVKTSVGFNLF